VRTLLPILGALALMALPVAAHHDGEIFRAGDIRVSHVHTDEPSRAAHGIFVYLTIENTGDEPDRLTAASVDFANGGVFQANVVGADGTLAVQDVRTIAIAPGQFVFLEPGGARIAFDDVQRALEGGDHFHMTLTFEKAGTLEVDVEVEHAGEHDEEREHHEDEHHHEHDEDAAS